MTLLFIQLAQSVTGAVITIVALLIVAAAIGYLTAWFYAKSVYTPVIKGLEAEKEELLKQVASLKEDVKKLNSTVETLNGKISKLEMEISKKEQEIKELGKKIKE